MINQGSVDPNFNQVLVDLRIIKEEEKQLNMVLNSLKTAVTKCKNNIEIVKNFVDNESDKTMAPISLQLYRDVIIKDKNTFFIDIGAGYFIEGTKEDVYAHLNSLIALLDIRNKDLKVKMEVNAAKKNRLEQYILQNVDQNKKSVNVSS